jgi:O-antigen/teichoic acid export membrane protein
MQSTTNKKLHSQMSHGHLLLRGAFFVFLAEVLLPLTGIVTASYLARKLGAGGYGMLTIASMLVSWIELAINSLFSRATVKIVGGSADWRPAGAAILRLHICISMAALAACWVLARPLAALMGEPGLAVYFALCAIDIPIFAVSHCHRSILIGTGKYAERARAGAGRWISRMVLMVVLVELGFSINGAILGNIGASLVELAIARYYIRPSWTERIAAPVDLWDYAMPIFFAALSMRFLNLGLFLLKAMGASVAQAGIYGAAQNIAFVMPQVLGLSLSPLLLSTITRVIREDDWAAARILGRNAIRAVIAMLPLAVIAAAASREIAILLFGFHFAAAGPLIAILIFSGLAMILINLLNAILIAGGHPSWALKTTAPLLPLAIAGHFLAIPRFGAIGAAAVTTGVTCFGAIAGLITVRILLKIKLPAITIVRALAISSVMYPLVNYWPSAGLMLIPKIAAAAILALGGFALMGELSHSEFHFFLSAIRRTLSRKISTQIQ